MKTTFGKGGEPFMQEKKPYRRPEVDLYPIVSGQDLMTTSILPTLGGNETPLIFY